MIEKILNRNEITEERYREILDIETHHDHEIYQDRNGVVRWRENADVIKLLQKIDLNDLCKLFDNLGYDKNSEIYRKLYRDMGYTLYGYWEIFYWEANNDDAADYCPF